MLARYQDGMGSVCPEYVALGVGTLASSYKAWPRSEIYNGKITFRHSSF